MSFFGKACRGVVVNLIKTEITNIGDPFLLNDDGTYYMYATSAGDGFLVWKGTELTNLTLVGHCMTKPDTYGENCFWAPEVVKRADGKYVMHYTARLEGRGQRCGVAVADDPCGPFVDVYPDKPMFDYGYQVIDATVFADDDGQHYIYYVRDCWDNVVDGVHTSQIYGAQLDDTLTKITSEPVLIATPQKPWECHKVPAPCMCDVDRYIMEGMKVEFLWNEAPYVIKRDGKYLLTYSFNCFDSRYYGIGLSKSNKPLGEFVKCDEPLLQINDGDICGVGHSAFFNDKNGKLTLVAHCHADYAHPDGNRRVVFCDGEELLAKVK